MDDKVARYAADWWAEFVVAGLLTEQEHHSIFTLMRGKAATFNAHLELRAMTHDCPNLGRPATEATEAAAPAETATAEAAPAEASPAEASPVELAPEVWLLDLDIDEPESTTPAGGDQGSAMPPEGHPGRPAQQETMAPGPEEAPVRPPTPPPPPALLVPPPPTFAVTVPEFMPDFDAMEASNALQWALVEETAPAPAAPPDLGALEAEGALEWYQLAGAEAPQAQSRPLFDWFDDAGAEDETESIISVLTASSGDPELNVVGEVVEPEHLPPPVVPTSLSPPELVVPHRVVVLLPSRTGTRLLGPSADGQMSSSGSTSTTSDTAVSTPVSSTAPADASQIICPDWMFHRRHPEFAKRCPKKRRCWFLHACEPGLRQEVRECYLWKTYGACDIPHCKYEHRTTKHALVALASRRKPKAAASRS